jgi:hypothetical protein
VKASWVRIFQSDLKTSGGTAWMVHVALSQRLRQDQVEDGRVDATCCVGSYYSCFVIFYVLCLRGILIF